MAELVGLVASITSLAGAAAKVSLALFEWGRSLANARIEVSSLAADASNLSIVLEDLVGVFTNCESQVVPKTIKTVGILVTRCENILEELKVTIELVRAKAGRFKWLFRKRIMQEHKTSLEGIKSNLSLVIQTLVLAKAFEQGPKKERSSDTDNVSATTRRNINLLRAAVLNNRVAIDRLKETEREYNSDENVSLLADEKHERDQFRKELVEASAEPGHGSLIVADQSLTWEKVLLRNYKKLGQETPVSKVLDSTIPEQIKAIRASEDETVPCSENGNGKQTAGLETDADQEVNVLLSEWSATSKSDINLFLRNNQKYEGNNIADIPRWVQEEYTFEGYNPQNPAHWKPKANPFNEDPRILPHSRFAYEPPNQDQTPLLDLLASEGGAWVWRHDNGYQRDYFIGNKKILQYFVHSFDEQNASIRVQDRTIVGKQWVSKDILEGAGLQYREYGEGSYSIAGKLRPTEVQSLHEAASKRTEDKLRILATKSSSSSSKATKPTFRLKVLALFSHSDKDKGYLSFKKGDVLILDGKPRNVDGWWQASLGTEKGWIPSNYVRIIEDNETPEMGASSTKSAAEDTPTAGASQEAQDTQTTEAQVETERTSRLERWKARFDNTLREATETWNTLHKEAKEAKRASRAKTGPDKVDSE